LCHSELSPYLIGIGFIKTELQGVAAVARLQESRDVADPSTSIQVWQTTDRIIRGPVEADTF
jgi:hypothetical protein